MNRRILPNNITSQAQDPYGRPPAPPQQQQQQPPQLGSQDNSGGGSNPPNPPQKPTYAKRGKITIVACVSCRKRKTKCDGKRPSCTQCQTRDGVCSYDMTDEQRKLTYLRDNVEQLQERSNALESLLRTFQSASDEEAAEVFRRLRSGTAVHVVAEQVQAGHLLSVVGMPKSSYSPPGQPESSRQANSRELTRVGQYENLYHTLMNASPSESSHILQQLRGGTSIASILGAAQKGSLTPQPLINPLPEHSAGLEGDFSRQDQTFGMVKGADVTGTHASSSRDSEFVISQIRHPWTLVTQDDELVEHLVTLYFTWQHCFFQSFPEKLFRADMAAGRTKFCSSMLVNAICAAGCFLSNREVARNDVENGRNLISKFFDEATRLVSESTTSNITTTATLYLLSYVEGTRGNLTSLWMYSGRSSLMAMDLNLHLYRNRRNSSGSDEEQAEIAREEKARSHAFWGCMHVDQTTSFTLGRLPNININGITVGLPPIDEEEDNEPWEALDLGSPTRPGARSTTFRQCSELSKILNSTLMMFFAPSVPLTGALLLDEYQKYLDWHRDLPSLVAKTDGAPPHVLCLHLYYHTAVLLLFRPFLKAKMTQSTVVPREVCRQAANTVSEIVAQHRALYDVAGIYMFQVHCLLTACTIHIVNVPSIASTNYLTQACNTFQDLIPRNEWARSSLGILRGLVEKWRLVLPLETEEAMYRDLNDASSGGIEGTPHGNEGMTTSDTPTSHWPRGPDPLATHPKGAYMRGNTLVPLDPRLTQDELATGPPGQHDFSRQQDPSSPGLSGPAWNKRSSTSRIGDNASSHQSTGGEDAGDSAAQKRQRTMPRQQPSNLVPISTAGTSGPASSTASSQTSPHQRGGSGSPTSYLYAPMKGQPAPLVGGPVHSSTTANTAGGGQHTSATAAAEAEGTQGRARGSGGGTAAGAPATAGKGKRRLKDAAGGGGGREVAAGGGSVEGITFGDDWRDPFMGFLGQEE